VSFFELITVGIDCNTRAISLTPTAIPQSAKFDLSSPSLIGLR